MTEDEIADLKLIHQAGGRAVMVSGALIVVMVLTGPISFLIVGPVFVKLLLMGIVSPVFVLGFTGYRVNRARIGEGKTSLWWGKNINLANHQHRINQAQNMAFMALGAAMVIAVAFVDISHWKP